MKQLTFFFMALVAGAALAFDCSPEVKARARDFIDNEKQFHLGFLPTEQSNPITATLEEDFKRSTLDGVKCLQRGDRQIPITMRHVFASDKFTALVDSMEATLKAPKGRIIFSGCGATGRLSILLESMWRDFFFRRAAELTPAERALADRSASIMTGGDFALIKSVESFEDCTEGGRRQAKALDVGPGDTFVAITEGGETSSVLGTLDYAVEHGAKCFLVFNNPAYVLRQSLDRCRKAIDDPRITVIDLYCGSMSLAGSTRMQATSSEQLLASCALEAALCRVLPRFAPETAPDYTVAFEALLAGLESPASRAGLVKAIEFEKAVYDVHGRLTYFSDDCMMDLFTDNTERSPTFMLPPLKSSRELNLAQSWAFVKNPLFDTTGCWDRMMHRFPRCLDFTSKDARELKMPQKTIDNPPRIKLDDLMAYRIGNEPAPERIEGYERSAAVVLLVGNAPADYRVAAEKLAQAWPERVDFQFGVTTNAISANAINLPVPLADSPLEIWKHLGVKLAFNCLSTGTMAAMGRVAGNWMSWVSISNKKLIDRGIRLLVNLGGISYEEAAQRLFAADEWIAAQDWTGREMPCAVQVALQRLRSPLTVEVSQTSTGPRLFVNGEMRLPRFYYGSPTCLCNISDTVKHTLVVPFAAVEDTTKGQVALDGYYGVDPIWYSDAKLVDLTTGTTNVILKADEEVRSLHYVADNLSLKKGHRYQFIFTHRATHFRTYFYVKVSYEGTDGKQVALPYYYGDTLGDTVKLAANEGAVDLVTFSTDSSWGSEGWWNAPEEPENYSKLDAECTRLISLNPHILLVPRITVDAPVWFLQRHPECRMVYDTGVTFGISTVSSRPYRKAAVEAVEKLARHLKTAFPNNFAGLQISGQNSAEWFYMMSQTVNLSGYDTPTRDAFRDWLKEKGDPDWATAEVPTSAERHLREKSPRVLEFTRFRQREMSSFLVELGAAAKRGSNGQALSLFFYGYAWELGGVIGGAGETGHFDFAWLMDHAHGAIDGFSSPISYSYRNLLGSTLMMSAAESVMSQGYLWFNEIDHRTHLEDMWDHMSLFQPYTDPNITRELMLRDSAADILRGYGDWWMDLFGRGWFKDADIWKLRGELNALDEAFLHRKAPYSPVIASVVDEESFLHDGWESNRGAFLDRRGFATCGLDCGQYLLSDFLAHPPKSVKLVYLTVADHLTPELASKLATFRAAHPEMTFVTPKTPADLTAEAIAEAAKSIGLKPMTAPGQANITSAEGYVVVQSLIDGPLTITLPSGKTQTLALKKGETKILRDAR